MIRRSFAVQWCWAGFCGIQVDSKPHYTHFRRCFTL